MLISLHKNATTTPATRLAIQQAHGTEAELAQRFGVGKLTIRKGRKRTSVEDGCHPPHRLQTTLNAGQEEIVVYGHEKANRAASEAIYDMSWANAVSDPAYTGRLAATGCSCRCLFACACLARGVSGGATTPSSARLS